MARALLVTLAALALLALPADAGGSLYQDPDQVFTVELPEGYLATRTPLGGSGVLTRIQPDQAGAPAMIVLAVTGTVPVDPSEQQQLAGMLFDLVQRSVGEGREVAAGGTSPVPFAGRTALAREVAFDVGEGPRSGPMLVVFGERHALLVAWSALEADAEGRQRMEHALATFVLEPGLPADPQETPAPP